MLDLFLLVILTFLLIIAFSFFIALGFPKPKSGTKRKPAETKTESRKLQEIMDKHYTPIDELEEILHLKKYHGAWTNSKARNEIRRRQQLLKDALLGKLETTRKYDWKCPICRKENHVWYNIKSHNLFCECLKANNLYQIVVEWFRNKND